MLVLLPGLASLRATMNVFMNMLKGKKNKNQSSQEILIEENSTHD